jgi:uncharacterized protein
MKKMVVCIAAVVFTLVLSFPHAVDAVYQWTDEQGQVHITDYPKGASERGDASVDQRQKHSLWRIRSKTNTVYLLGSVHMLKKDDYPLGSSIERAYDNSSRLFFEVNLDLVDQQKLQQLVISIATYTGTRTLKDDLSKQTYAAVQKRVSDMGLNIEQFNMIKPWFLGLTLSIGTLQKLGYDYHKGVDNYFYEKAKQDGKSIAGFETMEYQMGLFSVLPADMQDTMMLQTLKELDVIESRISEIVEAWKTGDADGLGSILLKSYQEYPAVHKAIVLDRNRNWLPRIQSLIGQKQNCMVIVGVAHLVGADGIIALLKQKGYQVEQL